VAIISDISAPDSSSFDDESAMEDWRDDFRKIAKDLEDEGPDNCDYTSMMDE
jgi:hypothetical protein